MLHDSSCHEETREKHMRRKIKVAAVAIALAGFSLCGIARAAVEESSVTVAYADGYMGTDGQFHAWEHRSDAEEFRAHHADKYHPWRHDDSRHQQSR
jgi:hypothetical protein